MRLLMNSKCQTIAGAVVLGGVYGLIAQFVASAGEAIASDYVISILGAAALFGASASAVWRMINTSLLVREWGHRPPDYTLCYRGHQMEPSSSPESEHDVTSTHRFDDRLRYRGVRSRMSVPEFSDTEPRPQC